MVIRYLKQHLLLAENIGLGFATYTLNCCFHCFGVISWHIIGGKICLSKELHTTARTSFRASGSFVNSLIFSFFNFYHSLWSEAETGQYLGVPNEHQFLMARKNYCIQTDFLPV